MIAMFDELIKFYPNLIKIVKIKDTDIRVNFNCNTFWDQSNYHSQIKTVIKSNYGKILGA